MNPPRSDETSVQPSQNRLIAAAVLLFITLLLSGLWIRSHQTFDYWTSPDLLEKNHRLSVGSAWGQLMIAYGWPSATSSCWRANSEPVFGNEPGLKPEERALPEERLDLARQQFGFQIDGVAVPVNYPFAVIPIWLVVTTLLVGMVAFTLPALLAISSQDRGRRE